MNEKPVFIYDGDCSFCKFWIDRWKRLTGDQIDYKPFQEAAENYPEISLKEFQTSVWLFSAKGSYYPAARAVLLTISHRKFGRFLLLLMYHVPGMNKLFDWIYYFVAVRRAFFWKLTKLVFKDYSN